MTIPSSKLAEYRAAEAAATKGPWRIDGRHDYDDGSPYGIDRIESACGVEIITADSGVYGPHGPDAEFIALSREAVPALLAENEALRAALREACEIAKANIIVPPPFAPAAPSSIDGSLKSFTVVIDTGKPYREKARIAELLKLAGGTP